ncbi:hypothetical protein M918_04060 [Clostridium sp. BL8]|nr:hypothetical protein M918_04060 [Clostridium sp. BL8]
MNKLNFPHETLQETKVKAKLYITLYLDSLRLLTMNKMHYLNENLYKD